VPSYTYARMTRLCSEHTPPVERGKVPTISEPMGRTASLATGLLIRPVAVRTIATLMTQSPPGMTSWMHPSCHHKGGTLCSFSKTMLPTLMLDVSTRHLLLSWSRDKYSLFHLFQKCCCMWVTRCRLLRRPSRRLVMSGSEN